MIRSSLEPFLAEIRIFSFGYAPAGWTECDGRLLPVDAHQPLFSILGWRFGGDGITSFALPNMHRAAPVAGRTEPECASARLNLTFGIAFTGLYPTRE
jgi:microcystin-dependent protein